MNNKQQVSQFRYPRQVPVRTSKADFISKDLVRRGFRSVGPTVVYSFMQVSGLTNDHLISCFRFHECISKTIEKGSSVNAATNELRRQENGSVLEVLVPEAVDNKLTLLCPWAIEKLMTQEIVISAVIGQLWNEGCLVKLSDSNTAEDAVVVFCFVKNEPNWQLLSILFIFNGFFVRLMLSFVLLDTSFLFSTSAER